MRRSKVLKMQWFYEGNHGLFPLISFADDRGNLSQPLIRRLSHLESAICTEVMSIVKSYYKNDLVSFYYRGSSGNSTERIRIDFVIVVKEKADRSLNVAQFIMSALRFRYSFIRFYNCLVLELNDVNRNEYFQFIIAILSKRLSGVPLERQFLPIKLGPSIYYSINVLEDKLAALTRSTNDEVFQAGAKHLIKHILRASFETICIDEKKYTRDLWLSAHYFLMYYPEYNEKLSVLLGYLWQKRTIARQTFLREASGFIENLLEIHTARHFILNRHKT